MSLVKLAKHKPSSAEIKAFDNYRSFQRKVGTGALGIVGGAYGAALGHSFSHGSVGATVAGGALGAVGLGALGYGLSKLHDNYERKLFISGANVAINHA